MTRWQGTCLLTLLVGLMLGFFVVTPAILDDLRMLASYDELGVVSITVGAGTGTLFLAILRCVRYLAERRSTAPLGAPGAGLRRFAQLWFSKKIYLLVFEPILSDLLEEYFEALEERDRLKARIVLLRGYGTFWLAFVAQLPVSLAKVVVELWIASKG